MRVRLSLTGDTQTTAVLLEGPVGVTLADALPVLGRALGGTVGSLSQGGTMLAPDAVIGRPPLLDGASLRWHRDRSAPPGPRPAPPPGAIRAVVMSGPDAGHDVALDSGIGQIGRSPGAHITIDDPGISREHCRLEVASDGVFVHALPTTNPTVLEAPTGQRRVVEDRAPLGGSDRLRLGASVIGLRTGRARPARTTTPGDGTAHLHRVPRDLPAWAPPTLREPTAPSELTPARFPWLTMLLPIPVCAVMAWFWGPQMLAFALLGPVLTGGNAIHDRISLRKQRRIAAQTYAHELAAHAERVEAALTSQRLRLEHVHPDPAAILGAAGDRTTRLWERTSASADMLSVRLGRGQITAALTIVSTDSLDQPEPALVPEAPVVLDLARSGALGIDGDPQAAVRLGRLIVGQLASLVVPRALTIWTLGPDDAWQWTSLLPHAAGTVESPRAVIERLSQLVAERGASGRPQRVVTDRHEPAHLLVVPNAAAARALPGFAELLEAGPAVGIQALIIDPDGAGLPAECRSTVRVTGHAQESVLRDCDGERQVFIADGVGPWWSEQLSRALAPIREANVASDTVPDRLTLDDIAPTRLTDLLEQWQRRNGPRAVVGASASAPFIIDLVEDGPHALVGGTTGSGKSEFLRALVVGLAAGSSPEDVSLVLIDYKGGSAFRDLSELPHITGIVTDLDPALADRALRSLNAEIRRRERLLATADCPDLAAYHSSAAHTIEPLPRLVIVIDELRMLVDELPDFVSGLVRLASVGRSLGIHLVLATQRPAGAVTPDIAANVNLRIALRVRDRVDSESIIGSADAAAIDEATPGRALASTGSGTVEFQSALVSGSAASQHTLRVCVGDQVFDSALPQHATCAPTHPADGEPAPLAGFIALVHSAASATNSRRTAAAWLDPLPESVASDHIAELTRPRADVGSETVSWGLVDRPEDQAIRPLTWQASTPEHVALIGSGASGRTSALVTLAAGAAMSTVPIHIHVLDGQGQLDDLKALPVTGSVVRTDDRARVRRLLTMLRQECQRRQEDLTRRGFASVADWQATADPQAPATLLLLIDGWDAVVNPSLGDFETHALGQDLIALLRSGIGAGLRCVATGGQSLAGGSGASAFGRKVALGTLDLADAALLGLRGTSRDARPAGHGVEAGTGAELLIAHLGLTPTREAQRMALLEAAARCTPTRVPPRTLAALPVRLDWAEFVVATDAAASDETSATAWVGVDEDLEPVGLTPTLDGRHWLVAGARRSGRSTALTALATSVARAGNQTVWIRSIRGSGAPTPGVEGLSVLAPTDQAALIEMRRANPQLAVFVDDADLLGGTEIEQVLIEIDNNVDRTNGLFACSADTATLATAYRGLCVDVATRRTGLLLGATSRADGDIFATRLELGERLPGRGHLISVGTARAIQVALTAPSRHSPVAA